MEPLLFDSVSKGQSPSAAAAAAARRSLLLYSLQLSLVVAYTAGAFALPDLPSGFMSEAAHIAALHAGLFVLTAALSGSLRYLQGDAGARGALAGSDLFPLTPFLAEVPAVVVTFANALLLPVLGLEAWLRGELGPHFSVLLMVQILAVAEAAAVAAAAGSLAWRYVQFRKVLAYSHVEAFSYGGREQTAGGREGGFPAASSALATPYGRERGRSRGLSMSGGGGGVLAREASSGGFALPFTTPAKALLRGGGGGGGGEEDEEAGSGSPEGGAGTPALAGAHFVSGAAYARALERLSGAHALAREREQRIAALTVELDATHAGAGGGDLASLLRSTTGELLELQEAHRALAARADGLEDTIGKYEAELRRAAGDVARFRLLLKEERRKCEKLSSAVEVGREANARAHAAIVELNARLASAGAGAPRAGGTVTADSAAAAAAGASAAAAGSSAFHARLARTASRQASSLNLGGAAQGQG